LSGPPLLVYIYHKTCLCGRKQDRRKGKGRVEGKRNEGLRDEDSKGIAWRGKLAKCFKCLQGDSFIVSAVAYVPRRTSINFLISVGSKYNLRYLVLRLMVMKTYGGVEVKPHTFLSWAINAGDWSASRFGRFTQGITFRYPLNRRPGGSGKTRDIMLNNLTSYTFIGI
jgi:hypothetical protein